MSSKDGETAYKTKGKKVVIAPHPEHGEQAALESIASSKTSEHSTPRLRTAVKDKFENILNQINEFGAVFRLPTSDINMAHRHVYENVVNARQAHGVSQEKAVTKILENISKNKSTARDYMKLLYDVGAVTSASSSYTEPVQPPPLVTAPVAAQAPSMTSDQTPIFDDDDTINHPMEVDTHQKEPELSPSQLKHISEVMKIMEKEPQLKKDIKRTITEELTKGYINHDQFKKYSSEIERVQIEKEIPEAIREIKTSKPKPSAKKAKQQVDTLMKVASPPVSGMDIDMITKPAAAPVKPPPKIKPKTKATPEPKGKMIDLVKPLPAMNTSIVIEKPIKVTKAKPKPAPKGKSKAQKKK